VNEANLKLESVVSHLEAPRHPTPFDIMSRADIEAGGVPEEFMIFTQEDY